LSAPPRPGPHTVVAKWYPESMLTLISDMMLQDRFQRLSLPQVLERVTQILTDMGITINELNAGYSSSSRSSADVSSDSDAVQLVDLNRFI
jgi:hypothetical protein